MGTIRSTDAYYRFNTLDAAATLAYIGLTTAFGLFGEQLARLILPFFPGPAVAIFAVNVAFYSLVAVLAAASAWRVVARDLRILGTRPWFTLAMVPLSVLAMLIFTALLMAVTGTMESSQNQLGVQSLMSAVPAWLTVPLLVIVGPFVEEYLFRHLLIGKLSRRLNIWACCALSVFLFAGIHVVGGEGLVLPALAPYLGMGAVLVAVYVWTGKNLMFSYFVHAAKNLLAVVLIYALPADLLPN